jgi:pyridoxine kinase
MYKREDTVLIINDFTGYGKISTTAMIPVLSHYGYHTYHLPTAIVSNTLDYGKFEILDTTEFMRGCIAKWRELGFTFKNVSTGLINSKEQVDIITDLISSFDSPYVQVDPIMGDDGKLYDGVYPDIIECNRKLIGLSDITVPNFTEACLLADMYTGAASISRTEASKLVDSIRALGAKDIVIGGCVSSEDGSSYDLVFDSASGELYFNEYEHIPTQIIGTGDVFSAILLAEKLRGSSLYDSVVKASSCVRRFILSNTDNPDKFDFFIEKDLDILT